MSSFFDDLEAQLRSAARARAGAPAAAGQEVPRGRRGPRGWLRAGIGAVPLVAAVLVPLVVVGAALVLLGRHGSSPPTPPSGNGIEAIVAHTPRRQLQREFAYITAATQGVQNSRACPIPEPVGGSYAHGSPGSDLLSILGVLRRPATPAERRAAVSHSDVPNVYRAYVRRAFSAGGGSYYIVPARYNLSASIPSDRCFELQVAALNRYLPKIPESLREPTRRLEAAEIAYARNLAAHAPRDTICLDYETANGGGGACSITAKEIEEGLAVDSGSGIYRGVVPDGVGTVTLIFPASRGQARRSVTVSVKGNVFAVPARGPSDSTYSPTLIWRSAQGRVLKRISSLAAASQAAACKPNPIACQLLQTASAQSSSTSSTATAAPRVNTAPAQESAGSNRKP